MSSEPGGHSQILWLNGRFVPARQAAISPLDRGFLYGDGVFETMRAERGRILCLKEHIERLQNSLVALRIRIDSLPDWDAISRELLGQNDLLEKISSVKIIVSRGVCSGIGLPAPSVPTICLIAQSYTPPTPAAYRQGWRLHVHHEGFSPPLAAHKSLNYLYFALARQAALDAGAHEALILDPQGKVMETAAGSILARTHGQWWTPAGTCKLPGITIRQVSKMFCEAGRPVESRAVRLDDFLSAETVWLLNSLMLIMPVSHIGTHRLPGTAAEEASRLRVKFIEQVFPLPA